MGKRKPVEKVSQCIAVVESERTYRVSMGCGGGGGFEGAEVDTALTRLPLFTVRKS